MYDYEKYLHVKAEIEQNRLKAEAEADAHKAELREISPEIRKIDEELSKTGPLLFKAALAGEDVAPIRARNEELNAKRQKIIKSLGYPEDYTDAHYSCPVCKDTGYVKGQAVCKCLKEALIKATILSSGIGHLIEKQSFESFNVEYFKDDAELYRIMKINLKTTSSYAENFSKDSPNLLLYGHTGTGKTHLSTAIARKVIEKGYDVIYDSTQNIISDFETDRFKNAYSNAEPKAEKYLECDLLILDDLGTEFVTPFTISCLYNLLNTRQNRGLPTLISTNLSPTDLQTKYEDRICSRIMGRNCIILGFKGTDRRVYPKK